MDNSGPQVAELEEQVAKQQAEAEKHRNRVLQLESEVTLHKEDKDQLVQNLNAVQVDLQDQRDLYVSHSSHRSRHATTRHAMPRGSRSVALRHIM
jgi:chromosome segregation ATPase